MHIIRQKFNTELNAFFDGKTVAGPGADMGIDIPDNYRSKIHCYFDQTGVMEHPSISVKPIQTVNMSESIDPGAGVEQFKLDVIIRASIERQGWAICGAIEDHFRTWRRTVNKDRSIKPDGTTMVVTVGQPTSTDFVEEVTLIALHVITPIYYVRPPEVFI